MLHGDHGIEVKASRFSTGWQGHNVETGWIMIVQYFQDPKEPTIFDRVLAAQLEPADWSFSGRGATSRRTPTASIKKSGVRKLEANAVYLDPHYRPRPAPKAGTKAAQSERVEG